MLSWMEMRHSGVHLLVRHQEHALCSTVFKHLSRPEDTPESPGAQVG